MQVGAKVLLQMLKRFGLGETGWLIEWSFDQLYGWHDWAWLNRQLAMDHGHGLIAAGSSPVPPFTRAPDCHANLMQCARWETGMDNSPMYDGPDPSSDNASGPIYFNSSSHLMELMDVGMTANLASDMIALATIGETWCNATAAVGAGAGAGAASDIRACGAGERQKIATLRQRSAALAARMQANLWDDELSAFVNKMPRAAYNLSADAFYPRLSPTSFYPLLGGMATAEQAERTVTAHLLNATRFCVVPEESWPPAPAAPEPDQLLLQSWQMPSSDTSSSSSNGGSSIKGEEGLQLVALCAGAEDCAKLSAAGGSLLRNESLAWSKDGDAMMTAAAGGGGGGGRTPLYRFHLRLNHTAGSVDSSSSNDGPAAQYQVRTRSF